MKNEVGSKVGKRGLRQVVTISFALMLVLGLSACGGNSATTGKMTQDKGVKKMESLVEKLQNGEITAEEFAKQSDKLAKKTETPQEMMKRTNSNESDFTSLPSWAKKIGMVEVKGLKIKQSKSDITKAVPDKNIPASFMAYYTGSAEDVLKEGKRLVEVLKLKENFNIEGVVMASGDINGYSVNVSVRTDIDEPFLSYSSSEKTE